MKKLVVLNHKMYLDFYGIKDYIRDIKDSIRTDIDVVVCPSTVFIPFFVGKYYNIEFNKNKEILLIGEIFKLT